MWLLSWWGVLRQTCLLFLLVTSKTSNIRANFENLAKEREQEDRRKAEAERAQRMAKDRQEQEEARRKLEVSTGAGPVPEPCPAASPSQSPPAARPCGRKLLSVTLVTAVSRERRGGGRAPS